VQCFLYCLRFQIATNVVDGLLIVDFTLAKIYNILYNGSTISRLDGKQFHTIICYIRQEPEDYHSELIRKSFCTKI
jgi:hypothetical protein